MENYGIGAQSKQEANVKASSALTSQATVKALIF